MTEVLGRAQNLIDVGRYDEGLNDLRAHLSAFPEDGYALTLAARALIGLGRRQDALECAQRAVVLRPGDAWPVRLLASIYARSDRSTEAIDAARLAISLDPNSWMAHYQLAYVRWVTDRVTPEAFEAIDTAVGLAPNEPSVHLLAGHLQAATGETKSAAQSFRRVLALDPEDAVARHELARMSMRRRRFFAAADGFGNAVALDPKLQIGVWNLDVLIMKILRPVYFAALAAAFLQRAIGPHLAVPGVLTGMLVVAGAWFWRSAGRRLARYLVGLPSREPLLALYAAALVTSVACLWVAATIGGSIAAANLLPFVPIAIAAFTLSAWGRSRRDRRRSPNLWQ